MAALIKIDHSFTTLAGRANAIRFCARCGEPAEDPPHSIGPASRTRVCESCGMGMLLSCAREALPGRGAAFLIVAADLTVSALSEAAEPAFGDEGEVLGTEVGELLTSPLGDDRMLRAIGQAALRAREADVMPVRGLRDEAAPLGMMAARISTCGRPRAALVTVEPSGFGQPR